MKSWYLIRVFKSSWLLGFCVVLFICGELFFNIKRIHNFPFFVYDMYSHPQQEKSIYQVYSIYINGKIFDYTKVGDYKEGILLQTLRQYEMAKQAKSLQPALFLKSQKMDSRFIRQRVAKQFFADSSAIDAYPSWFFHTLQKMSRDSILSCRVEKSTISYQDTWIKNPVETNVMSFHED